EGGSVRGLRGGGIGCCLECVADLEDLVLDRLGELLHFKRALVRNLCQIAYFISDHGKTTSLFASAGSFNGCVEREQIGLIRDAAYHAGELADVVGAAIQ